MMKALLLALALLAAPVAEAQVFPPGGSSSALASEGAMRAVVTDVAVKTKSKMGPYTAFFIRPAGANTKSEWYYIRNDDVAKALERGAMIGLLMGAAQANRWVEEGPVRYVNIEYVTINGDKHIVAASLVERLR
jgi:hypothetical protein